MRNRDLAAYLNFVKLPSCTVVRPNHIFRSEYSGTVRRNGENVYRAGDFLIITDENLEKKAIIQRLYNDVHWYVYKKFRNQHWLSDALRTGCIQEVWPNLKSVSCYHADSVEEFGKATHLAGLAGLTVRDDDPYAKAYRLACAEFDVTEIRGEQGVRFMEIFNEL